MAFGVSTARGEFDASGSQAGPVQIQANQPRQNQDLEFAKLLRLINTPGAVPVINAFSCPGALPPPRRTVKAKPGPMKRPVPKPRKAARIDKAEDLSADDW
jgi:hypothetical protein